MPTKKFNCTLPDKPSELIMLALRDLAVVESMKKDYVVDMHVWHIQERGEPCAVCFAGSVMAKTCGMNPARAVEPSDFTDKTHRKLMSLDYFRKGMIFAGLREMRIQPPDYLIRETDIISYKANRRRFKLGMQKMAEMLTLFNL